MNEKAPGREIWGFFVLWGWGVVRGGVGCVGVIEVGVGRDLSGVSVWAVWDCRPLFGRENKSVPFFPLFPDVTTGEQELKNLIYRSRRRSELNSMMEKQAQTQAS